MPYGDRRRDLREFCRLKVWILERERSSWGTITDISQGGAFVESALRLPSGEVVELRFERPGAGRTSVRATVLHWRGAEQSAGPVGFGVRFERKWTDPEIAGVIDPDEASPLPAPVGPLGALADSGVSLESLLDRLDGVLASHDDEADWMDSAIDELFAQPPVPAAPGPTPPTRIATAPSGSQSGFDLIIEDEPAERAARGRAAERFPIPPLGVLFEVGRHLRGAGQVVDVSRGGLFVLTAEPPPLSQMARVKLQHHRLPTGRPIELNGRIAWVGQLPGGSYGFALSVVNFQYSADAQRFAQLLRWAAKLSGRTIE